MAPPGPAIPVIEIFILLLEILDKFWTIALQHSLLTAPYLSIIFLRKLHNLRIDSTDERRKTDLLAEFLTDVDKFKDYANKEGWAYKESNSHSSFRGIVYKGSSYNVDMEVEVRAKRYENYP